MLTPMPLIFVSLLYATTALPTDPVLNNSLIKDRRFLINSSKISEQEPRPRLQVRMDQGITQFPPGNYNQHEPPSSAYGKPLPVIVYLQIFETPVIHDVTQVITLEILITLNWEDERLSDLTDGRDNMFYTVRPTLYEKVWTPDVYINMLKKDLLKPPLTPKPVEQILITEQGRVFYTTRVTRTLSCKMNFERYPSDKQKCIMDFVVESPDNRISLKWLGIKPIDFSGDVDGPHFSVQFNYSLDYQSDYLRPKGIGALLEIEFRRKVGHHILQTYLPSGIIVVVTWFSLFIPVEGMSERLSLCTTTLLTLTALFGSIRWTTPSVSYIMALDIWVVGCVSFVFLILAENVIVLNASRGYLRLRWVRTKINSALSGIFRRGSYSLKTRSGLNVIPITTQDQIAKVGSEYSKEQQKDNVMAHRIDLTSRVLVMGLFGIFIYKYIEWIASAEECTK